MRLYEISDAIERVLLAGTDQETGEIMPEALAELEALEMARDEKALAVAAYLIGERVEADAIEDQAERLQRRAQTHRNRAARLEEYLAAHLEQGCKLSDARVEISWRRSKAVELDCVPESLPIAYQRLKIEADKLGLRKTLEAGGEVKGARLVERWKLQVR